MPYNNISLLNIPPTPKGEIRNPKGRGKNTLNVKTIIENWLKAREAYVIEETGEIKNLKQIDIITLAMLRKARKGDVYAFNSLLDRAYGKPLQQTEFKGDPAAPFIINLIPAPNCEPLRDE